MKDDNITVKFAYITLGIILAIPFVFSMYYQYWPNWKIVFRGVVPVAMFLYPASIVNTYIYIPIMGKNAAYLSFLTGNITNIKLPCFLNAVQPYSNTSAIIRNNIATIAIATSALTTTFIIAITLTIIYPFTEFFNNDKIVWNLALSQILPCLFGAIAAIEFPKKPKVALANMIILLGIITYNANTSISSVIIISMLFSILISLCEYKVGNYERENFEK